MTATIRLRELGIPDPKVLILHAASSGLVRFPVPVTPQASPSGKKHYRKWVTVKERNDWHNLQAKLKRAMA